MIAEGKLTGSHLLVHAEAVSLGHRYSCNKTCKWIWQPMNPVDKLLTLGIERRSHACASECLHDLVFSVHSVGCFTQNRPRRLFT